MTLFEQEKLNLNLFPLPQHTEHQREIDLLIDLDPPHKIAFIDFQKEYASAAVQLGLSVDRSTLELSKPDLEAVIDFIARPLLLASSPEHAYEPTTDIILGLSGDIDSTVQFLLVSSAISKHKMPISIHAYHITSNDEPHNNVEAIKYKRIEEALTYANELPDVDIDYTKESISTQLQQFIESQVHEHGHCSKREIAVESHRLIQNIRDRKLRNLPHSFALMPQQATEIAVHNFPHTDMISGGFSIFHLLPKSVMKSCLDEFRLQKPSILKNQTWKNIHKYVTEMRIAGVETQEDNDQMIFSRKVKSIEYASFTLPHEIIEGLGIRCDQLSGDLFIPGKLQYELSPILHHFMTHGFSRRNIVRLISQCPQKKHFVEMAAFLFARARDDKRKDMHALSGNRQTIASSYPKDEML